MDSNSVHDSETFFKTLNEKIHEVSKMMEDSDFRKVKAEHSSILIALTKLCNPNYLRDLLCQDEEISSDINKYVESVVEIGNIPPLEMETEADVNMAQNSEDIFET